MKHHLYLANTEPRAGKAVLLLGLMEWLSRRGHRVSVFRPVTTELPEQDPMLDLMRQRYATDAPLRTLYGCTLTEAQELQRHGGRRRLLEVILDRFHALESACDGVLCIGTDFGFGAEALELDFNIEVARNLGAAMVLVGRAEARGAQAGADLMRSLVGKVRDQGGTVLMAVLNRVPPAALAATVDALNEATRDIGDVALAALPEDENLQHPTLGDVATALGADQLMGVAEDLNREFRGLKVAAMALPNFLGRLDADELIITPGDRADIIVGTLAAYRATTYPQVAGILLSGDLAPAAAIKDLLDGLDASVLPVFCCSGDTLDTALAASRVRPGLRADNPRKVAAALGLIESHLDLPGLLARLDLGPGGAAVTPLMFEYELVQRAKGDRRHIVLPESDDERILRAAEILLLREVADLTLLGQPQQVEARAAELGLNLSGAQVVDPADSPWREQFAQRYFELRRHKGISIQLALDAMLDVSYFGTMMVYQGLADGMVSGAAHTTQHTIRPAFEVIRARPDAALVSSVFFMCLPDRVLVYGDCAINPEPDAAQLAAIAIASADTAAAFGVVPRVALLSYSTGGSGKGPEVDKVREATRLARERRPQLQLDGPIQYDAAVDAGVAAAKAPDSPVAGRATVLVFPDLNTGNNTYKAVQRSAGAVAIGPVLQGLKQPVNDLSRGCTVTDIVNTVAITAIQAQTQSSEPGDATRDRQAPAWPA